VGKEDIAVCLVEDASSKESVCGQVVCNDRRDLEVPPYLQDAVHDLIYGLLDLLVREDIYIVKDAHGFF
jgi:hypothetical protein